MRGTPKMLCAAASVSLLLACGCDDDDAAPALLPPAFDLTGTWNTYRTPDGGSEEGPVVGIIDQVGNSLLVYDDTGTQLLGSGAITGNSVTITFPSPIPEITVSMTGTATSADHVEGTYVVSGPAPETGTWRCERIP